MSIAREPEVPPELIAMDHVVLFPHLGSASVATREKMDQLVVDNLLAWAAGKPPLTPVAGNAVAAEATQHHECARTAHMRCAQGCSPARRRTHDALRTA